MTEILKSVIAAIGIDIGKNWFHVVGLDGRGAVTLRQKWSRGQVEARLGNMPPCLIGMEARVGAHHLSPVLNKNAPRGSPGESGSASRPAGYIRFGPMCISARCNLASSDTLARFLKARSVLAA